MRKRQELCSETQASAYSMLNQCLQLPQKYYPSLFEQQSPQNFIISSVRGLKNLQDRADQIHGLNFFALEIVARVLQLELQMSCELLLFTTKMFILFCTAMPQRSETFFCIAHAFGKDFAHFLFV